MIYTYIIWSLNHGIFYKGINHDPEHRLWEHNNNMCRYTAGKGPWSLVYFKQHESKREALIEGKRINCHNERLIRKLISSPENLAPPLD